VLTNKDLQKIIDENRFDTLDEVLDDVAQFSLSNQADKLENGDIK
jgi:dihydroneopterin aldolase